MKPFGIKLFVLSLAILFCSASIKALWRHPIPSPLPSVGAFSWRAQQLLSYAWVRITNPPKYGTLRWEVQQAKLKGARELESYTIACGGEFRDPETALQEALSIYSIITAELIQKNTYADESNIHTWYKFKIIETLSPQPSTAYPILINPPKDSLPIAADEIVILEGGGTMNIDGMKVTHGYNKSVSYLPAQKYLIFLRLDSATRTGYAHAPTGVFTINSVGEFKTIHPGYNPLQGYLQTYDQNSYDRLRADIQERLRTKR
jgi:hypothetical protein